MGGKREEYANTLAERKAAAIASRGAPRRMDEDEKRRRYEQMKKDAESHEKHKDKRIAAAEERDRHVEELEAKMRNQNDQSYFKEMRTDAYMGNSNANVADR